VTDSSRAQLGEEVLRRLAAAVRSMQLYTRGHPLITRNLDALAGAVRAVHDTQATVVIGLVADEVIVDETPIKGELHAGLVRRLKQITIERITIERGVTSDELASFVEAVTTTEPGTEARGARLPSFPAWERIRVGRVAIGEEPVSGPVDTAGFRRMYDEAVSTAETVWESARLDAKPDAAAARTTIDSLAQAVSQNRTALLALTTLKSYDNYTFTHMVNVSLLTMAQARSLGIDGALLREVGLAALMHDIGKVRTPLEILNKPEKLTNDEFRIMQRHTVDGAEILRGTPDMPTLAPVVAFEHHLRLDGTGYPAGVKRPALNLGTMLCSIADVYDAMRSQRRYQEAFPSDRILEVLRRNDGQQFDQHLVRRFSQLLGIYPVGNVVKLDSGETAIVVKVHAPDPHRPQVRVVIDAGGRRLERPYDVNLWEQQQPDGRSSTIQKPVDPAEVGLDPLAMI
jgi:putative nucleotidyltransferase with HDIG domain